ncbi:unnamed protein product [Urochloa humidicola]
MTAASSSCRGPAASGSAPPATAECHVLAVSRIRGPGWPSPPLDSSQATHGEALVALLRPPSQHQILRVARAELCASAEDGFVSLNDKDIRNPVNQTLLAGYKLLLRQVALQGLDDLPTKAPEWPAALLAFRVLMPFP